MTAEPIARSVSRLVAGRFAVKPPVELPLPTLRWTVIDMSRLRADLVSHATQVDRWDCVLAPTLIEAVYAYYEPKSAHSDRTAVVMAVARTVPADAVESVFRDHLKRADWSKVRWVTLVDLYMDDHEIGLVGPIGMFPTALDAEGRLLDYGAMRPFGEDPALEVLDTAYLIYCAGLNFLNCVNVTYVEPKRDRAEQRRMMRYGLKVHELVVRSRQEVAAGTEPTGQGIPLTTVRGHLAHYGERYGRKRLFGVHEGRFWVPQHVRGDAEFGVVKHDYRLEPDQEP